MAMSREYQEAPGGSGRRQANELIRLIRKRRWMGLEQEVDRAQSELAQCGAQPTDSVIAASRETD